MLFDKVMEGFGVVHVDHVGEFMDDDVVDALFWGLYEMDVEGDDAAGAAVAPLAFHTAQSHGFGFESHDDRVVVQTLLQVALRLLFVEVVVVGSDFLFGAVLALCFERGKVRVVLQRVGLTEVEDLFTEGQSRFLGHLLKGFGDPRLFFVDELEDPFLADLRRADRHLARIGDAEVDVLHAGADDVLYFKALVAIPGFQASP